MTYIPDIEYDSEVPQNEIRKIPLKDILTQHRKRYKIALSVGDVVLKKLTLLDSEVVYDRLCTTVSGFVDNSKEAAELFKLAETYKDHPTGGLDAAQLSRLNELGGWLKRYAYEYAIPCFIEPKLQSVDELSALMESLTVDEKKSLKRVIMQLTSQEPGGAVSDVGILIAKEFNIPMPADLNLENMTQEQAAAFAKTLERRVKTDK